MIQENDIVDAELLKEFQSMAEERKDREEAIELIPCVGLLHDLFVIPKNAGNCLMGLRARINKPEGNGNGKWSARISYRLYSLYAWEAELAEWKTNSNYTKLRKRMKEYR